MYIIIIGTKKEEKLQLHQKLHMNIKIMKTEEAILLMNIKEWMDC